MKAAPKFKVGYEVVVVGAMGEFANLILHQGKVTFVDFEGYVRVDDNYNILFSQDNLEFAQVFNSPLYQALR